MTTDGEESLAMFNRLRNWVRNKDNPAPLRVGVGVAMVLTNVIPSQSLAAQYAIHPTRENYIEGKGLYPSK